MVMAIIISLFSIIFLTSADYSQDNQQSNRNPKQSTMESLLLSVITNWLIGGFFGFIRVKIDFFFGFAGISIKGLSNLIFHLFGFSFNWVLNIAISLFFESFSNDFFRINACHIVFLDC